MSTLVKIHLLGGSARETTAFHIERRIEPRTDAEGTSQMISELGNPVAKEAKLPIGGSPVVMQTNPQHHVNLPKYRLANSALTASIILTVAGQGISIRRPAASHLIGNTGTLRHLTQTAIHTDQCSTLGLQECDSGG